MKSHLKVTTLLVTSAALALIGLVGYIGYRTYIADSKQTKTVTTQQTTQNNPIIDEKKDMATRPKGTEVTSKDSEFGQMLFDGSGQAIYIWEVETSSAAECYGDCADAWPPVLTNGLPVATGEVKSELLGTTTRSDGNVQVTYNGHPLYYYAHEVAGEVKCHNIRTHGGLWWVIQPNGIRAS